MMKKSVIAVLSMLVMALMVVAVQAQGEAVAPGSPVKGEITDDNFAIQYTYEGEANQVLIVNLAPVDTFGDLNSPALILRNPAGDDLARYDGYGNTTLIWQLPENGTYTIVATRTDDSTGTSVGEFTLSVDVAAEMALDEPATGSLTSSESRYYVYRGADDFAFSFARQGDFAPEFSINTIDTQDTPGTLDTVAAASGKMASVGTLGNITGGEVYVIKVSQALFDFYFDEVSADYAIKVTAPIK